MRVGRWGHEELQRHVQGWPWACDAMTHAQSTLEAPCCCRLLRAALRPAPPPCPLAPAHLLAAKAESALPVAFIFSADALSLARRSSFLQTADKARQSRLAWVRRARVRARWALQPGSASSLFERLARVLAKRQRGRGCQQCGQRHQAGQRRPAGCVQGRVLGGRGAGCVQGRALRRRGRGAAAAGAAVTGHTACCSRSACQALATVPPQSAPAAHGLLLLSSADNPPGGAGVAGAGHGWLDRGGSQLHGVERLRKEQGGLSRAVGGVSEWG